VARLTKCPVGNTFVSFVLASCPAGARSLSLNAAPRGAPRETPEPSATALTLPTQSRELLAAENALDRVVDQVAGLGASAARDIGHRGHRDV
jgi:hypothetical protein